MIGWEPLVISAVIIGVVLGAAIHRRNRTARPGSIAAVQPVSPPDPADAPASVTPGGTLPVAPDPASIERLYGISGELWPFYQSLAHPKDLVGHPLFSEGVRIVEHLPPAELARYFAGDNSLIGCVAAVALSHRPDGGDVRERILGALRGVAPFALAFGLRYLHQTTAPDEPLIGRVLAAIGPSLFHGLTPTYVAEFIETRLSAGEAATFGDEVATVPEQDLASIRTYLDGQAAPFAKPLLAALDTAAASRIDRRLLQSVGMVWGDVQLEDAASILEHAALTDAVATLEEAFERPRPRSVVLVGEAGTGKTTAARSLARRLHAKGWIVFEAGHAELAAGQIYVGALEQRIRDLVGQLRGDRKALWLIPDLHLLASTGVGEVSRVSALDMIIPYLEQRDLKVLADTEPQALQRLLRRHPRVASAFTSLRLEPLAEEATLGLAASWLDRFASDDSDRVAVLGEVAASARAFLSATSRPGNVLDLLARTRDRLAADRPNATVRVTVDDIVVTLTDMTGLPRSLLDDRLALPIAGLRQHFDQRIVGQAEAVDCLVERVAMIKAGLTDPSRPAGVFLFAGPTGTGKTEIAKALTEWMFGDAERMIRLDMSELQTAEGLDRILGSSDGSVTDALVDLVRRRPFSVLLLDEFEKASDRVWDVFLQVFDDARLTDRRGATVDFRHTVIILTSNLGGVIPSGVSVGFGSERQGFDEASVIQAIEKTFRKEFINRLDRVVVFRPLTRDLMRQILQRELDAAFDRRGLRARAWAVEWDEAAIEFLLDRGFTRDLGSRPLKRAIERYLLSPLAVTMVEHRVPAGEQFLFISRDGDELKAEFVDPDGAGAEAEAGAPPAAVPAADEGQGLGAIVLHPQGTDRELHLLRARFERLSASLGGDAWHDRKASTMALMGDADFWQLPDRFEILAQAEYIDRIDSAARRLKSLLNRLHGAASSRRQAHPAPLLSTAALNLYLLETACADVEQGRPFEAFVLVEPESGTARKGAPAVAFAAEIGGMYTAWIRKRRMHGRVVEEERTANGYRLLLAVAGFGAFSILDDENGLHVLEQPGEGGRAERMSCRVRVVPQDAVPPDRSAQALKVAAERRLAALPRERPRIVRRYRRSPSPLVRDVVRGWKTGRLDLVLGGDFDLLAGC